jgi:hypothetical protein
VSDSRESEAAKGRSGSRADGARTGGGERPGGEGAQSPPVPPKTADLAAQYGAVFVSVAAARLERPEHRDLDEARRAIDAARALVELCAERERRALRDALAAVQLAFARAVRAPAAERGTGAGRASGDSDKNRLKDGDN